MALRKYDWNTFLMWIKGALFQATGNPISAEKISLKREPILLSQFCVIEHYCVSKYLFLRIVRLMTFAQIHRETKNRNAHFLWAQSISTNLSGIIWFNSHFPYLNNNPMFFSVKPNNSGFRWVKSCVLLLSTLKTYESSLIIQSRRCEKSWKSQFVLEIYDILPFVCLRFTMCTDSNVSFVINAKWEKKKTKLKPKFKWCARILLHLCQSKETYARVKRVGYFYGLTQHLACANSQSQSW